MKKILSLLVLLSPAVLFASDAPINTAARSVDGLLNWFIYIAGRALPLLILAALVLFLFGIVKRFFWGKDAADRGEAGRYILWGVVALFVMVSVWGLVNVLRGTFNLDTNNIPVAPAVPVQQAPYAAPTTR
jgi:Type IV secretion system pilin